jgi:drug/metabolite transporter (DMT)-like permease
VGPRPGDGGSSIRGSEGNRESVLGWALPLATTVLAYGLAAGIWKQAALTAAQFCVLFVAVKVATNLGAWWMWSRRSIFEREARGFIGWCTAGHLLNGLAWICYFTALSSGPVAIVQTMTAAYTALATLLALVFLRERLAAVQAVAIALAVASAMLIGYASGGESGPAAGRSWFIASLLTIGFWAAAVVFFKHAYNQPGADDWRFFVVNFIGMALTALPYGLLGIAGASWSAAAVGLGLAIVALYAIGDLALFAAIRRGPAAIVSPLSGLYPIPTIVYAALVLGEGIGTLEWIAMAMVLIAIVGIVPEPDNPVLALLGRRRV